MTTVFNTALSGMQRNLRSIETSAHNVANVNTDGYRAQKYDPVTGTTSPRYEEPVPGSTDPDAPIPSDVDLATEFVDIKRHQIGYEANALLVSVADEMLGELLDILA